MPTPSPCSQERPEGSRSRTYAQEYFEVFKFWTWTPMEALVFVIIVGFLFDLGTAARQQAVTEDTYARRTHAIQAVVDQLPSQGASALMVTSFRTCLDHSLVNRSPTNTSLPMVERVRSSDDLLHQVWRPCALDTLDEVRQQQGTTVEARDRALLDVAQGQAMTAWNTVPDAKRF